ncbi:MAG: hypothetical protein WKG07_18760 [Hymenobacter sp.]
MQPDPATEKVLATPQGANYDPDNFVRFLDSGLAAYQAGRRQWPRPTPGRRWLRVGLALLFVARARCILFSPKLSLRIVRRLPAPRLLVLLSGAAEGAGGLGLLLPDTRRWAAWEPAGAAGRRVSG